MASGAKEKHWKNNRRKEIKNKNRILLWGLRLDEKIRTHTSFKQAWKCKYSYNKKSRSSINFR